MAEITQISPRQALEFRIKTTCALFKSMAINAGVDAQILRNLLFDLRAFETQVLGSLDVVWTSNANHPNQWIVDLMDSQSPYRRLIRDQGGILPRPGGRTFADVTAALEGEIEKRLATMEAIANAGLRRLGHSPMPTQVVRLDSLLTSQEIQAWVALERDAANMGKIDALPDEILMARGELGGETLTRQTLSWSPHEDQLPQPLSPQAVQQQRRIASDGLRGSVERSLRRGLRGEVPEIIKRLTVLNKIGLGFAVLGIGLTVYQLCVTNDWKKDVVDLLVGTGGGVVGGRVAGSLIAATSICGPYTPVCRTVGVFLGGFLGSYLAISSLDYARETLAYKLGLEAVQKS